MVAESEPITQPPQPTYHPDRPPSSFAPGYCQVMLQRYQKTWLSVWVKPLDHVIRYYSTRWPKFLRDLSIHRANELANVAYAQGLKESQAELDAMTPEKTMEPVECISWTGAGHCGNMTTKPRQRMMYRGEEKTDGCEVCQPLGPLPSLKDLALEERERRRG